MAAADCSSRRRFTVACSVLSRCVRAKAHSRSLAAQASPMQLMPGADVVREATVPAPAAAQLTILYGGRVLVFDDVRADRAAEVMRVAARQGTPGGALADDRDLQVPRKASLQRLVEKRRDRLGARAPYAPAGAAAVPKEQQEKDLDRWLALGLPGESDR